MSHICAFCLAKQVGEIGPADEEDEQREQAQYCRGQSEWYGVFTADEMGIDGSQHGSAQHRCRNDADPMDPDAYEQRNRSQDFNASGEMPEPVRNLMVIAAL